MIEEPRLRTRLPARSSVCSSLQCHCHCLRPGLLTSPPASAGPVLRSFFSPHQHHLINLVICLLKTLLELPVACRLRLRLFRSPSGSAPHLAVQPWACCLDSPPALSTEPLLEHAFNFYGFFLDLTSSRELSLTPCRKRGWVSLPCGPPLWHLPHTYLLSVSPKGPVKSLWAEPVSFILVSSASWCPPWHTAC